MNEEKELAEITKVWFGQEDHGILTLYLTLDYEGGSSQGYGGYGYAYYDSKLEAWVGHPTCAEHILAILETFGVSTLEGVVGKKCWVYFDGNGFDRKILRIESLRSEGKKTLDLKRLAVESAKRVDRKRWGEDG